MKIRLFLTLEEYSVKFYIRIGKARLGIPLIAAFGWGILPFPLPFIASYVIYKPTFNGENKR